ncbi:MAG: molybdate ABC transporter substrate-binding protein [Hydrogenoanaerobacterium sp.]
MKKLTSIILSALLALSLASCGAAPTAKSSAAPAPPAESTVPQNKPVELTVFAAASLTETMDEIIKAYKATAPDVSIVATYDSSGTLKTQIAEGASCDIFISAAGKQMDALESGKSKDNLDFIAPETRVKLLENKVVLIAPKENPAKIAHFSDIATCKLVSLGNSDVPVGGYSLEILKNLGIDIKKLESDGKVTYGSNVKEVLTQVKEGVVDCGIVYATDAASAGLDVIEEAKPDMCSQVIYPAAILKNSANKEAAQAFLTYLQGDEAMKIFRSVGFMPVK